MARYQGCASGDAAASSSESATDVTNTSCDGETLSSRTAASFSDETSRSVTIAGTNLECTSLVQQASAVSSSRWLGTQLLAYDHMSAQRPVPAAASITKSLPVTRAGAAVLSLSRCGGGRPDRTRLSGRHGGGRSSSRRLRDAGWS